MNILKKVSLITLGLATSIALVSCTSSGDGEKIDNNESAFIGEKELSQPIAWSSSVEKFLTNAKLELKNPEPGQPDPKEYDTYFAFKDNCQVSFITSDIIVDDSNIPSTFNNYKQLIDNIENIKEIDSIEVNTNTDKKITMWGVEYSYPNLEIVEGVTEENFNPETDLKENGTINVLEYFITNNVKAEPRQGFIVGGVENEELKDTVVDNLVSLQVRCLNETYDSILPGIKEKLADNEHIIIRVGENE